MLLNLHPTQLGFGPRAKPTSKHVLRAHGCSEILTEVLLYLCAFNFHAYTLKGLSLGDIRSSRTTSRQCTDRPSLNLLQLVFLCMYIYIYIYMHMIISANRADYH